MDRAVSRIFGERAERFLKELGELSGGFFTACLRKVTVLNPALPGNVTVNRHVVRRVDEY